MKRSDPITHASTRHPFEVFLLILSIISGLPVALGNVTPGSVSAALSPWAQRTWGAGLTLGAIVCLLGILMTRPNPRAVTVSITGMVIEQVGLVMVGGACMVYVAALIGYVGLDALVPASIVLAYGASCLWRWHQIQRLLILERDLRERDEEDQ